MIGIDSTTKNIIKATLTEDFAKENNKIFSLSEQTYKNFRKLKKYLSSFFKKNSQDLLSIFSENILLVSNNKEIVGRKNVIEELLFIILEHNPDEKPIKLINSDIRVSMNIGEAKKDCHEDSDGTLFVVPWYHCFSCRVILKYYEIENVLDLNHFVEFDDLGTISKIILHKM